MVFDNIITITKVFIPISNFPRIQMGYANELGGNEEPRIRRTCYVARYIVVVRQTRDLNTCPAMQNHGQRREWWEITISPTGFVRREKLLDLSLVSAPVRAPAIARVRARGTHLGNSEVKAVCNYSYRLIFYFWITLYLYVSVGCCGVISVTKFWLLYKSGQE
jgi:hypothetical protein